MSSYAAHTDAPHLPVRHLGDVVHLEVTDAKGEPQGTIAARPIAHFGSAAELARASLAQRGELPAGFESFTCEQMHQFYVSHGVEMTLEYAAALQREARLTKHENTVVRPGADADHEGAALAVDTDDGAGKHAASLRAPTPDKQIEAARSAIEHLLQRLLTDARVAYYFDPITESFALLTQAHALLSGQPVEEARTYLARRMFFAPPTCHRCGGAA